VSSALAFVFALGNAPFAIAVGVAVAFALLQVTGLLGVIAGERDGDADHDGGGSGDHDADADADHDADHGDGRGWGHAALAPLGLGKVPFSVLWQTFALAFAGAGLAMNARYLGVGAPPLWSLAWSVPVAFVAGYVATAVVSRVLGPVLSTQGQEATTRAQLVGQMGVVISTKVDREFGEVRIRDKTGHDLRVVCKLADGAKRVPTERQSVVVVDYEPERGGLFVEPLDDDDEPPSRDARRKAG
jgi:membrane protein implicated in regulation of membrane protease activity